MGDIFIIALVIFFVIGLIAHVFVTTSEAISQPREDSGEYDVWYDQDE